jgi:hypothetical protein
MIFLLPACGEKAGMRGAFARLRTRHCSLARIARITPLEVGGPDQLVAADKVIE